MVKTATADSVADVAPQNVAPLSSKVETELRLILAESTPRERKAVELTLGAFGYAVSREGRRTLIRPSTSLDSQAEKADTEGSQAS